jgi:ketosteroid isomerase-like protein
VSARRDLVERFYASFDAADVDAARECFAPDVADAALATWREFTERVKGAAPDARLQVVSAIEEGDRIAVEGTLTGTFTAPMRTPKGEAPPSGNAFSLAFADVFTTAEGRIVRHTVYFDQVEFLTQLGLLPAAA